MHRNRTATSSRCGRLLTIGALTALLLCHGAALAQLPPTTPVLIELPAQPLADALRAIARQAGVSILFDPGAVTGKSAPAVSGRLTAIEAITRVLEGSGLQAEAMKDGSLVVRPLGAPSGASAGAAAGASGQPTELQKVDVTGSHLARIAVEGPTPVQVYTRQDIDRSGQPTLERFLSSLNEVSASQGEGGFGSTLGQSTVQLRGLPLGSTLVLINGRRIEAVGSSSANFFDLSLIPLAAIERIEIVPVGSSAVYGGDALAGVVNVILKKSLDGPSLSASLGSGRGTGDGGISLATGGSGERGSFLVLGSYSKTTPLNMSERSFFRDADYRRYGGPDARTRACTPGTVSSTTGGNLPGLGSSFAGIPRSTGGAPLQVSDFEATAGQANLCNPFANGNGYALVHGRETTGLHATGELQIAGGWQAFSELTRAHERVWADEVGLPLSNVLVPASNPYNPFGEAVRVTAVLGPDNGERGIKRETTFTRALGGLRGELGAGWDAEVALSTTRDRGKRWSPNSDVDTSARSAALAASSTAEALNPFTDGRAASDEVLDGIWSDGFRSSRGRKNQASAFVRGSPFKLPGGPLEVIVGGELMRDQYATAIPGDIDVNTSRRSSAAFAELRAPIWRADPGSGKAWDLAALTVAGRRDHYSDFGSAGTYQAGLEVRPVRSVLLRASTATSFKPPTLLQTHVDEADFPADLFGLVDPARGGEPIESGQVVQSSNPDLKPEHGRANSLGALWEPESSPGTRLGVTLWRIKIKGLISVLLPQTALDYEALFPGFVERGPSVDGQPGPVTSIRYAETNFGGITSSGIDLEAAHAWTTPFGKVAVGASATRTNRYSVLLAPDAPREDRLGRRFDDYWSPRWKGRATAGLEQGGWSVAWTSRYLGSYKDEGTSDRRLGDFWLHDVAGSLDLKRLGVRLGSELRSASLTVGVANLFDRRPQFVETAPYFDVTQADWRGRYATARLSVNW